MVKQAEWLRLFLVIFKVFKEVFDKSAFPKASPPFGSKELYDKSKWVRQELLANEFAKQRAPE